MEGMKKIVGKTSEEITSEIRFQSEIEQFKGINNRVKGIESKEVISLEELVERLDIFGKRLTNNGGDISNLKDKLKSLKNITKNYCEENNIDFVEIEEKFKKLEEGNNNEYKIGEITGEIILRLENSDFN